MAINTGSTGPKDANDFFIERDSNGVYDLVVENGQFKTIHSFDTALQMVIHCERRADASEVTIPQYRRGWFGNLILFDNSFEIGSKLWLLFQERVTQETLNKAVDYMRQATRWLVEDRHVRLVEVRGDFIYKEGVRDGVRLHIDLFTFDNKVESRYYDLWQNTGKQSIIKTVFEIGFLLSEELVENPDYDPVIGDEFIANPDYDPDDPEETDPPLIPNPNYDPEHPPSNLPIASGKLLLDGSEFAGDALKVDLPR